MSIRDLKDNIDLALDIKPAAVRTNGTATGPGVDLQGYKSALLAVNIGAYIDGTHTPSLEDSADGTTYAPVASSNLQGTLAALSGSGGQNTTQRVGYNGGQRYIRGKIITASATSGAFLDTVIVRGNPDQAPLA